MSFLKSNSVPYKLWTFLRTYILQLPFFDLCLQGSLLILTMLETDALLLLRRDAGTGFIIAPIEDWVTIGAGVVEFLLGGLLAWLGRGRRQYAVSSWLGATALVSFVVQAFPFEDDRSPVVGLCNSEFILEDQILVNPSTMRTILLVITAVMCSLTRVSIWAHGLSYLDDHQPENGPYFYGILISIRLSLGLSAPNWIRPGSTSDRWWIGHLAITCLLLMFAILFSLFPKKMKGYKTVEEEKSSLASSFMRVLKNKSFIIQTIALGFLQAGVFNFVKFDNGYVQARFHIEALRQDPRTSRTVTDIFRTFVVIFFVMIFRVRFSVRREDGVKSGTASRVGGIVAIFVAIVFTVVAILSCPVEDVKGIGDVQPSCASECSCASELYGYSPVCDLDSLATHFSPCLAGCSGYEDLNGFLVYENCTCGAGSLRGVRGSCSLADCRTAFSVYQVFFTLSLAIAGAAILMQGMVILRCVTKSDKPLALGISFGVVALLTNVFGRLLYMLISDLTCAYTSQGACVFHHTSIWWVPTTSAILCLVSAAVSILVSKATPVTTL